jgi:hypothetical protein
MMKPTVPRNRKGKMAAMNTKKAGALLVGSMNPTLHAEGLRARGIGQVGVVSLRPTASAARSYL